MTQPVRSGPDAGETLKWSLVAAGATLAMLGWRRHGLAGTLLMVAGGGLAAAAAAGKVGVSRQTAGAERPKAIRVEKSITINRTPEDLYAFWRDLQNLPQFMDHLAAVVEHEGRRSTWVARAPAGTTVRWEAEVTEEEPGKAIAWRSLPGSEVPNEGRVTFTPLGEGRGTVVRVNLRYSPPAGKIGMALAKLFGEEPAQQVSADLRRLKWQLEGGFTPTTEGQASGRKSRRGLPIGAPGPL
jgi:uncharacterized membrane protein